MDFLLFLFFVILLFFFRRPQLHCNGRHRHGNLADALIRGVVITFLSRHSNNFGAIRWTFWIRNFFSLPRPGNHLFASSFLVVILTLILLLVWISDQINISSMSVEKRIFLNCPLNLHRNEKSIVDCLNPNYRLGLFWMRMTWKSYYVGRRFDAVAILPYFLFRLFNCGHLMIRQQFTSFVRS